MPEHEHVTFTSGDDVLKHAIDYLSRIDAALEQLGEREQSERLKLLLNSVKAEQRNLLGSLERLREDTSDKVRRTFAQYTVEMPTRIEPPDEQPLSTLGLIQWLETMNGHLRKLFAELSEKGDSKEAGEVFGSIADQVEAHDRNLSKEWQRTEDL